MISLSSHQPGKLEEVFSPTRTTQTQAATPPSSSLGFFIIACPSFISILTTLEIGLTSYPLPFMKTLTLLTPPFPVHTILSTHWPLLGFFLLSKPSYQQPFGSNFQVYLLPCASVCGNLEVRDCVFSPCHVYASHSVGT